MASRFGTEPRRHMYTYFSDDDFLLPSSGDLGLRPTPDAAFVFGRHVVSEWRRRGVASL